MKFNIGVNVNIEAIYDTETGCFSIISCKPQIIKKEDIIINEWMEHHLSSTQIKFGILTLGSRSSVGKQIPLGESITVQFIEDGVIIEEKQVTTHKTIKGRIDGLTSLYYKKRTLTDDTKVKIRYNYDDKILQIKV